MLEAAAQNQVDAAKIYNEMRNSLEQFQKLIDPRINAMQLAESLELQRFSGGIRPHLNQDLHRQTILVGKGTRTGEYLNLREKPMAEHEAVSVSLLCPISNAFLARTFSLQGGSPCKTSRMVELNFTHGFIEQLRQRFLVLAQPDASIDVISTALIRHLSTAGFEVINNVKLLEGYQLLGSNTLIKADPSAHLADCHFLKLNLHIGIVGGSFAVHWADSYCFNQAGHLSLFGI